jgi:hypothetical protein
MGRDEEIGRRWREFHPVQADHPDRLVVTVDAAIDALPPSERRRANGLRTVTLTSFGSLLLAHR